MAAIPSPIESSDQNNYSAPVLVIGLYVAAATMVCFLYILWDIILAIRAKKTWLPCRIFSLNSVTLSLLAIAAKLPVDLTTPMPNSLDQFSKLTGTILICVSMAFLFPSLGVNRTSECMTNLAALSIFVVTVIVNICIQISTGVIFSFILEHVITIILMLMLLCILWGCYLYLNSKKEEWMQRDISVFKFGSDNHGGSELQKGMLERLKSSYLHAYSYNPQYIICKSVGSSISCVISSFCLVIVFQAIIRTLIKDGYRFLNGSSDYGWSMRCIVGSQILLILLGSLATCFRGLIMRNLWSNETEKGNESGLSFLSIIREARRYKSEIQPFLFFSFKDHLQALLKLLVYGGYFVTIFIFGIPYEIFCRKATKVMHSWCEIHISDCNFLRGAADFDGLDECRSLLPEDDLVDLWTLEKCWDDIKKMVRVNRDKTPTSLKQMLLKYPPPLGRHGMITNGSVLDLVYLARIASVSVPNLGRSLTQTLDQVFDVIYFVDSKLNSSTPGEVKRRRIAKALWMGKDFSILLPKISKRSQSQSELEHAVQIIDEITNLIPSLCKWEEFEFSMFQITGHHYRSIEELYDFMEQLFASMLRFLLTQLPDAILEEIDKSAVEDYDKKVRYVLKLVCKMESLDNIVRWNFPSGTGITCMTTQGFHTGDDSNIPTDDNHP